MTLSEFKSWFEGFTENMEATPNAKQWKRIQKRVGEIDNTPISYPVYVDRYIRPYQTPPFIQYFNGVSETLGNSAPTKMLGDGGSAGIDMKQAGRIEASAI